ncbi:hypothetical protein CVT26_005563 [Gymnopilus dilepis]|uniref:Deacetylase sirtuin-type domain-containing protein n=1 Tax=Gymnopilus dilepis TaxID=231916 RepID=A0A409XZP8_9AGAR|nr:hypothetical protein CVT26_005563 [Gymnopilus dilepis]
MSFAALALRASKHSSQLRGVRAFHSPFAVLGRSPLTTPTNKDIVNQYEKHYDQPSEPLSTSGGYRTYVVSEPDASYKHYQVPAGAYPTSEPYVNFSATAAPDVTGAQYSSTGSNLLAHEFTTRRVPQNAGGVGESSAVRFRSAPGEMGARGPTMTLHLPLRSEPSPSPQPSFLVAPANHAAQLARAVHAIMKARRIVVICGAGISVQAGIPDFRSPDGLFQTLKRDNPKEAMSSGKELFDVSVFNSEQKTSLFCQMIAQLSDLSQAAQPTAFHHLLRALDERGRLLRVYTQNIDAIEQKSGLSFGVPGFDDKRSKARAKAKQLATPTQESPEAVHEPVASTSRLPSPPVETPRCIPLHGTLQSMHCQICNHSFPLQEYLPSLNSGLPPPCPECTSLEATRQLVGKRPRGIGRLRPSVVLYNETHKDGEGVGHVVQRDLMGSSKGKGRNGADLLLVVGTSLRVPGTKRMVREFAKAVKARSAPRDDSATSTPRGESGSSGLATPAPSPRRTPTADEELTLPKAMYLNLDFPVPTREWEGVFDAWIQGDAQEFAEMLRVEIDKEARAKEVAEEKKKRKEEEAMRLGAEHEMPDLARMQLEKGKNKGKGKEKEKEKASVSSVTKRKSGHSSNLESPSSGKRRKASADKPIKRPLSPPHTPPSPSLPRRHSLSPDFDDDDEDDEPLAHRFRQEPLKLPIRIPPLTSHRLYVPEIVIKSPTSPQYLRPYELERMRSMSGGLRRHVTPSPSPPPLEMEDVEVDVDGDVDGDMLPGYHERYSTIAMGSELPYHHQHQPCSNGGKFNKHTKAGRKAARDERRRLKMQADWRLANSHHYHSQHYYHHQHQHHGEHGSSVGHGHGHGFHSPAYIAESAR